MIRSCDEIKILMMKYLDQEASAEEQEALRRHLGHCQPCQDEFHQLKTIKKVTGEMKKQLLPEMAWEEYWRHLYNRLERGIAWILISLGIIILLGYASVDFVRDVLQTTQLSPLQKVGILVLVLGMIVLFVSVLREKLMIRRHDKYREVQR
ncbi:MAG: zf-HC2 domain-containing protein [Calditrichaeota bacterium]|nr:zf-HC2 domain-containing protein [Calditrichota bacterium]